MERAYLVLVASNLDVMGPSSDNSQRRALATGRLDVVAVTAATGACAGRLVTQATLGRGSPARNLRQFAASEVVVRSRNGLTWTGSDGESLQLPRPARYARLRRAPALEPSLRSRLDGALGQQPGRDSVRQ